MTAARIPTPVPDVRLGAVLPRRAWLITAAVAVHGCASAPPPAAESAAAGRDVPPAAARGKHPLGVERDWLRSWFDGTPVNISQRDQGPLSVEVPLAFSFEAKRSAVKPALAAVLDKLAQSLRRTGALLPGLAAPADPAGPPALALQRAGALRAHLLSRGVPVAQLGTPAATQAAVVQLRAELPPL